MSTRVSFSKADARKYLIVREEWEMNEELRLKHHVYDELDISNFYERYFQKLNCKDYY